MAGPPDPDAEARRRLGFIAGIVLLFLSALAFIADILSTEFELSPIVLGMLLGAVLLLAGKDVPWR
jgi:hypothetical protein